MIISSLITLRTIRTVGYGQDYVPHTLDSLKKLGLESHKVNSMASSFMSTLSNIHINLLAPVALLRKALTTHE